LPSFCAAAPIRRRSWSRDLPPAPATSAVDALIERAEQTRGQLLALQKDHEAAQLAIRAPTARAFPSRSCWRARSRRTWRRRPRQRHRRAGHAAALRHGRPERAVAQARASQAQAELEAFRACCAPDRGRARARPRRSGGAPPSVSRVGLKNSGEVERIAQVSYDAGERGILELLDAFRTSSSARVRQAALDAAAATRKSSWNS
jgi:hypothetical protein